MMKLLTMMRNGTERLGVKTEKGILDVIGAGQSLSGLTGHLDATAMKHLPATVMEAIEGGSAALAALRGLTEAALAETEASSFWLDEKQVDLGPCVTRPNKIICIGLNYRSHAEETRNSVPQTPILFSKFNNALSAHGQDIPLPDEALQIDYEAELAVVIGKTAKNVAKERALDYVFGYCCANDLSARDWQMRTNQWLLGKTCDSFCPIGPFLATADEVGDPNRLSIRCLVNGEVRQNANTSDMIFPCDELISYISRHMTLLPGDVILTGTPEGVILGYPKDRQVWLKAGDVVTVEIAKLGTLTNLLVTERI